ncbi:uncharacterized protein G2W53_010080 [Senna tora]|uniref:Uncharacterized protein n=1 Tax=Senna tora TaxID=362788 RepID=A0A834WZ90_9FABA|nr:uncharacterized protein G2W53_010080 [Senna tora]
MASSCAFTDSTHRGGIVMLNPQPALVAANVDVVAGKHEATQAVLEGGKADLASRRRLMTRSRLLPLNSSSPLSFSRSRLADDTVLHELKCGVIITILFSWNISALEDSQIWGSYFGSLEKGQRRRNDLTLYQARNKRVSLVQNIRLLEVLAQKYSNDIPTSVQEHLPYRLKPSASSSKFRKLIKIAAFRFLDDDPKIMLFWVLIFCSGIFRFCARNGVLDESVSREEKEYSMEELQKEHDYSG